MAPSPVRRTSCRRKNMGVCRDQPESRGQENYRAKFQAGRGPPQREGPATAFPWALGREAGGTCEGRACERTHPPGPSRGAFPKDMGRQESVKTLPPAKKKQANMTLHQGKPKIVQRHGLGVTRCQSQQTKSLVVMIIQLKGLAPETGSGCGYVVDVTR